MLKFATFALLVLTATVASADTYKWEDKSGIHFTDDLASVPKKYRKRAIAEASGDITTKDPEVARSVENGNRKQRNREAQEAAIERVETRHRARTSAKAEERRLADEDRIFAEHRQILRDRQNDVKQRQHDRQLQDIQDKTDQINRKLGGF